MPKSDLQRTLNEEFRMPLGFLAEVPGESQCKGLRSDKEKDEFKKVRIWRTDEFFSGHAVLVPVTRIGPNVLCKA